MQPFELSESFADFIDTYPSSANFVKVVNRANFLEVLGIVRLWVSEGIPFAFKHCPMLYEVVREWLASKIEVHPKEITLIGSARLGYSLSPHPNFGKPFDTKSDLDFSVISKYLFNKCIEAYECWSEDYTKRDVSPRNSEEKFFWDENLRVCRNNINRGFIDPNKIPLWLRYPLAQNIEQAMWLLKEKLKITSKGFLVRRSSIRVYADWHSFIRQLQINLNHALKNS